VFNAIFGGELMFPALPSTVALAIVALLGYLVGRGSRRHKTDPAQARRHLDQALGDARLLEQLTDDVLMATRHALDECRRFSPVHGEQEQGLRLAPVAQKRSCRQATAS
jgi:hypothetical protein